MMGEQKRWTWSVEARSPVSDRGRYNQVITSDKAEEEKDRRVLEETDGGKKRRH